MNKKLIALAVAGATVAPVALAQTANPVTLYGRVHITVESIEAKGDPGLSRRSRMQDQASLLGVRGTEDLGGGLKAFFQLETAFNPEQAPGTFANRNSGVGLQGGWGSLLFGRWDSPFKTVTTAIDPFGDVTIAGYTQVNNDQGNFDRRANNVIQYWSPNFGGFAFRLQTTLNDKSGDIKPVDNSGSVTFSRGPAYVFVTYEEHKDQVGTTATSGAKEEGLSVGGTLAFGPIKVGAAYGEYEKTNRSDRKSWLVNLVWSIGKNNIIFVHQESKDGGLNSAATQPDCDANTIGYQYVFSRRTSFFGLYTKVDNNSAANCGMQGGAMIPGPVGSDPQGISLGLRHTF